MSDLRSTIKPGDTIYAEFGRGTEGPHRKQWKGCEFIEARTLTDSDGIVRELAAMLVPGLAIAGEAMEVGVPWCLVRAEMPTSATG